MKVTYQCAYQIPWFSLGTETNIEVVPLAEQKGSSLRAVLCSSLDDQCSEIDRGHALAYLMLTGGLGSGHEERLAEEIEKARARRSDAHPSGPFLLVEVSSELEVTPPEIVREFDEFTVAFDAIDKEPLRSRYRGVAATIVGGLQVASTKDWAVRRIGEGIYLTQADGKTLYSFSASVGTPTVVVASPIENDLAELALKYVGQLSADESLSRPLGLFLQALDLDADPLRRFLSGWSALEILVNKLFPHYQRLFLEMTVEAASPGIRRFSERIRDVMKDKYRLADKFALLCAYNARAEESDITTFENLKKTRDRMLHGEEVTDGELSLEPLRSLFAKCLRGHLDLEAG